VSIKGVIRDIDRATAYTREWKSYESLLDVLKNYGIPFLIFLFCLMFVMRLVIKFELRSFLSTILNLFNIHGFIGDKIQEKEQEEQEKVDRRIRRRKARRQRRYKEHGLVKKRM